MIKPFSTLLIETYLPSIKSSNINSASVCEVSLYQNLFSLIHTNLYYSISGSSSHFNWWQLKKGGSLLFDYLRSKWNKWCGCNTFVTEELDSFIFNYFNDKIYLFWPTQIYVLDIAYTYFLKLKLGVLIH